MLTLRMVEKNRAVAAVDREGLNRVMDEEAEFDMSTHQADRTS